MFYDLTVEHYFQALDFNKRKKETKKSYKLTTSSVKTVIHLPSGTKKLVLFELLGWPGYQRLTSFEIFVFIF